jgi:hypothetical protein
MRKNPMKMAVKSRSRGRPTRAAASRRALEELGVDPTALDPLRILAAVAADESAPASSRVMAAKALLAAARGGDIEQPTTSRLSTRALELLSRRN